MLPGKRSPTGQVYVTADPPDATCTFSGGIAVTAEGAICVVVDDKTTEPHNVTPPSIAGSGKVGEVLTATPGVWEGEPVPTVVGNWQSGGHDIVGATGLTFTPTIQNSGEYISYKEVAHNSAGKTHVSSNQIRVETVPIGGVPFDNYGGFNRGYWNQAVHSTVNLQDGLYHYLKPSLSSSANPGGTIFHTTAEMAALAGVAWFDNNGTLGHIKIETPEADVTNVEMAGYIDAKNIFKARLDLVTDPAHPVLYIAEVI